MDANKPVKIKDSGDVFLSNGKYLMVQFMELLGHMAAKTPQPDQQN